MSAPTGEDLTTVELIVLAEAGGDNDLSNAFGSVQLYSVFEREEELLEAVEGALLRLFDLGLIRLVEASYEVGYTAKRHELPAMTREQLVAELHQEPDPAQRTRETAVFYDPTPAGEALLSSVPKERIPLVSGIVQRPWLE